MFSRFALALAATASMLPMTAYAQDDEEIVVTAQKREELLREVPQSVTALTNETLERLQADSFEDYAGRVPGMVASTDQPGNSRIVLRGLNNEGVGAAVATYVDETPFGSSSGLVNAAALALDLDPFDVARLEVLRGPQGTLYGASAMAGLIKFVTRDPSFTDTELRIRTTGETTDEGEESWAVRAAGNIPLGDQAGLRISGFRRTQGGFIDRVEDVNLNGAVDPGEPVTEDANSIESSGLRATFLLQATDNLSFRLSATTQDIESENFGTVPYDVNPDATVGEPTHGDLVQLGGDFANISDTAYRVYNATINWDLGWASLVSSTSYGELDQYRLLGDALLIQDNDVLQDKVTQEFRLISPSSDGLEWMLGAYLTREQGLIGQFQNFAGTVDAGGLTAFVAGLLGITEAEVLEQSVIGAALESEYTERALFGEVTYHFTPQFDVTVGGRLAQNEQDFIQTVTNTPVSELLFGLGSGGESSDEDIVTYSASARWRPSDRTMFYGRVATGFRPGGPNILLINSSIPSTFDSDTLINYEIGVKTDLIDNVLRLDASIFHINWEDVQLLVAEITPGGLVSGNSNGGEATSQGLEWALTLTPSSGLSVLWTGAYTDAQLSSDPPPSAALAMEDGDRLPFSPEWSTAIDVDYEFPAFGSTMAYLGGGVRYVGEQMSNFATIFDPPPAQIELDSYTVVDLRGGLRFDNNTSVELFVRNAGDERGPTRMGPDPVSSDAAVLRPRTVGVTVSAEF